MFREEAVDFVETNLSILQKLEYDQARQDPKVKVPV